MKTLHTKLIGLGLTLAVVVAGAVVALKGSEPSVQPASEGVVAKTGVEAWPARSGSVTTKRGERHKSERSSQSLNSDEERIRLRTAALAEKLELSAGDEKALLAVFVEEQTRRSAAFRDLRSTTNQAEVRTELTAILTWKSGELRTRFGNELADALMRR